MTSFGEELPKIEQGLQSAGPQTVNTCWRTWLWMIFKLRPLPKRQRGLSVYWQFTPLSNLASDLRNTVGAWQCTKTAEQSTRLSGSLWRWTWTRLTRLLRRSTSFVFRQVPLACAQSGQNVAEEKLDSRPLGPSTINADEIGVAYGLQLLKWFIIHKAYFIF